MADNKNADLVKDVSEILGFDPSKTRKGQPTVTIKLTPALEAALGDECARTGQSRVRVATQALFEAVKEHIK